MSQPTLRDVHVDAALSRISIAYRNPTYIWDQVAPTIRVDKESDRFFLFSLGDWFRDEAAIRAPGTPAAVSSYTLSTQSYSTEEHAVAMKIADRVLANADAALDLRASNAASATDKVHLRMERQLASEIFAPGIWGTTFTPPTRWNLATSTPLTNVQTGLDTIRTATGQDANTLIIGAAAWSRGLKFHAEVTDVVKYTQKGIPTPSLLAQIWDLDKVLIGKKVVNVAPEGLPPSNQDIWPDSALLCYLPPAPGLMTPSAMYTFMSRAPRVRRWRNDVEEAEYVEASCVADFVVTGTGLGYFLHDVIS